FNASWGAVMIANTLVASASVDKTPVTAAQLFQLRSEGMGWGKIAAGLGFNLGSAVSAAQSEGRVAAGQTKPDGVAAHVRSEASHGGADAAVRGEANVNHTHVGADVGGGVGAGLKIGR